MDLGSCWREQIRGWGERSCFSDISFGWSDGETQAGREALLKKFSVAYIHANLII